MSLPHSPPKADVPALTSSMRAFSSKQRPALAWATRWAIHHSVTTIARVARLTPVIWAARRRVQVSRNVSYVPGDTSRAHRLDVHRPKERGRFAVVLYVHGGGFGLLSKDSHWHIATGLASHGFCVANINYRLAPKHPYPAALQDASQALCWVLDHISRYGGDASQLILAGESAGANIVTALTLAASHRFAQPWAEALYARRIHITAVLPACGLLDVADAHRYRTLTPHTPAFVLRHIQAVCERYTTGSLAGDIEVGLASPLTVLESGVPLARALPPFFITCGAADPILHDSTRLAQALERRQALCTLKLYAGEGHAFQALPWRPEAKAHWQDTVAYLREALQKRVDAVAGASQNRI